MLERVKSGRKAEGVGPETERVSGSRKPYGLAKEPQFTEARVLLKCSKSGSNWTDSCFRNFK